MTTPELWLPQKHVARLTVGALVEINISEECPGPHSYEGDRMMNNLAHIQGFTRVQINGKAGRIIAINEGHDPHTYFVRVDGITPDSERMIDGIAMLAVSEIDPLDGEP